MALILARSHGDKPVPRQYLGIGCCVSKRAKRTFSDHILSLQNLPYIPNRIITSGENRSSCIFTQQGRKGVFMMNVAAAAPVVYCKKVLETSKTVMNCILLHVGCFKTPSILSLISTWDKLKMKKTKNSRRQREEAEAEE
ncbi:hypothetical protein Bca52824_026952 [Brassica carinata]|uniref:Uncharacterized protein n=1 Tax=Brassica carinata TaxID=52824 RepID=A0A8X7SHL1_BRACI|nr:hypothetical protein Bca52824_026952 [Brassica carinata]